MKTPTLILSILTLASALMAQDAIFESSDGLWTDRTFEKKGRDFRAVLWTFESYKLKNNKPDVTLLRITPRPKKRTDKKIIQERQIKWKVHPEAPRGTRSTPFHPIRRQKETNWRSGQKLPMNIG